MNINDITEKERELISQSFLFIGVADDIISKTLASPECEVHVFAKNESVYTKEKFSKSLGMVLSGNLTVQKNAGSHLLNMNSLFSGNYFGAAAVFCENEEYVTLLKALKPTKVVFFSQNLLINLMKQSFTAAENYIRFLTGRIRFLNDKIDHLGAGSAERMLSRYLLNNVTLTESGYFTHIKCSYSELSSLLGIGRASLYRALENLENDKIIKRNKKEIELLDIQKLEQL